MNTQLYAYLKGEWKVAPWNNGEGGVHEPIEDAEQRLFCEIALEDAVRKDPEAADASYFCGVPKDGVLDELRPLYPAEKKFKGGKVTVAERARQAFITTEQFSKQWLQKLADSQHPVLAVDASGGETIPVWLNDGGRQAWITELEQAALNVGRAAQERLLAAQRVAARTKQEGGDHFINPYSFVPPPETVWRDEPPRGHANGAGGVSGWFDWDLKLQTELLLPSKHKPVSDNVLSYPGSSLRGVLRSLHEALAGGCMRVLDSSYVPVHRETMTAYKGVRDRLAVVRAIDPMTHAVTEIDVVEKVHWVPVGILHAGLGSSALYSGLEFNLDDSQQKWVDKKGRSEVHGSPKAATSGTGWVMHITDDKARRPGHTYYVAVGKLSGKSRKVTGQMWERFVDASAGSQDLTGSKSSSDTAKWTPNAAYWPPAEDVSYEHTYIGKRRKSDGWLSVGDTVWLTGSGELKMSAIWRSHGNRDLPVGSRLPEDLLPCDDPTKLCPSCSVFGAIKAEQSKDHEQSAYRTHVHIGWAHSIDAAGGDQGVSSVDKKLPPLRSPKPSSGGFYLEEPAEKNASKGTPRFHWQNQHGKKGGLRKIRGRKYYWHGQAEDGRQTARPHNTDQHGEAPAIPAGTTLRARVTFDNLDREQLGWLLAAAQPDLFFGKGHGLHIGGGKPLGYGTAIASVENLTLFSPEERYGSGSTDVTQDSAIEHVKNLADERGLNETHRALARLLTLNAVDADRISYPTALNFDQRHNERFAWSFAWFSAHSGARTGDLVPLPEPTSLDQYIDSREEGAAG